MKHARWISRGLLFAAAFATMTGSALSQSKELYFFNWAGYISPDLLKRFEAETGIHVILDTYDSNGALLAKLEGGGGQYDVAAPSQTTLKGLIDSGSLLKFDAKTLSNYKNIAAPFDRISSDPERLYSVPYTWGMTSFAYDSAKVPGGKLEDSWKALFEPGSEMAGKIAMIKPDAIYFAAALYLGLDQCTEKPEDAQKIFNLIEAQKPAVKTYVGNSGARDQILNGEVAATMIGNGSYYRGKKTLPTLQYVFPKEGVSVWFDNLVIPAKAKNVENAKIFLNWMMEPKNAAAAANFTGDGISIKGAAEFLDPALRDEPAVNVPPELASRLIPMEQCSAPANDLRGRVWTRVGR